MKNFLIFILFFLGFILIGIEGHNFFSEFGINIPSLSYQEQKDLQKYIGGVLCILSIILFRKVRSAKIKKEQEKEQERIRIENEKYNQWYNSLSEEEKIEEDYKKWVANTSVWEQESKKEKLLFQDIDNSLHKYDDNESYVYKKLTPLEERILWGSKEEREKEEAEAAIRAQERLAASKKRKADLSKRFSSEDVDKILKQYLWLGMTEEMLVEVKGEPDDTSESVSVGKVKKKYLYGKRENRVGNYSYDFEVSLVNDVVTGWKDRDN